MTFEGSIMKTQVKLLAIALAAMFPLVATEASARPLCRAPGVPVGCFYGAGAPRGVAAVGVGAPGVGVTRGVGVGARGVGVGRAGTANRGGPVNRVGVR